MTDQRDPDQRDPALDPLVPKVTERRDPRDYVRREDGSWNMLPIVLGALAIIGVGYLFLAGDRFAGPDGADNANSSRSIERTAPPAKTPSPN